MINNNNKECGPDLIAIKKNNYEKFFFCELALCQVCLVLPCLHGKNRYAKFCLPVNVASPVLWCSGNINVSNICV